MRRFFGLVREPRFAGLACAGGAVALGLCYLLMAGAPMRHLAINAAALLVGLAAFVTVTGPRWRLGRAGEKVLPLLGLVLLATALFGVSVEGASRWVQLGPLNLQVSLIILPAMIVAFARAPSAGGAAGMSIAALALALQPDRGMSGVLAAGLATLALLRPERAVLLALAAAVAGFAATLVQADALPALPFVDQIFYSAFDVHPLAGTAVLAGGLLLLLPTLLDSGDRSVSVAFGAVWAAVLAAAALGNYPTPLVGYGGSAIVGYLLSLALLPRVPARGTLSGKVRNDDEASVEDRMNRSSAQEVAAFT